MRTEYRPGLVEWPGMFFFKSETWDGWGMCPDRWPCLGVRLGRSYRRSCGRARSELADDYLEHVKANNEGWIADKNRMATLKTALGSRPAEIAIADLRKWFNAQE